MSSDKPHFVFHSILQSAYATSEEDADEPVVRETLLVLDEDLCVSDIELTVMIVLR